MRRDILGFIKLWLKLIVKIWNFYFIRDLVCFFLILISLNRSIWLLECVGNKMIYVVYDIGYDY